MIKKKGLNYDWKNITQKMSTQTIQTIVLPTNTKNIHLRKIAKLIKQANEIYQATACKPSKPTVKKYVVCHY